MATETETTPTLLPETAAQWATTLADGEGDLAVALGVLDNAPAWLTTADGSPSGPYMQALTPPRRECREGVLAKLATAGYVVYGEQDIRTEDWQCEMLASRTWWLIFASREDGRCVSIGLIEGEGGKPRAGSLTELPRVS